MALVGARVLRNWLESTTVHWLSDAPVDAVVDVIENPALNVVKYVSETSVDGAGDVIHYSITVANTGNQSLTGITVTDPFATTGPTYLSGDAAPLGTLDVGETWTYSATHTVTQAEIDAGGNYDTSDPANGTFDVLHNVATADSNETPEDTDDAVVDVIENPAAFNGTKTHLTPSPQAVANLKYLAGVLDAYNNDTLSIATLTLPYPGIYK